VFVLLILKFNMGKLSRNRRYPVENETPYGSNRKEEPNLDGDRLNFYLLILLYIIQGFPIGLSIAFPIILQSKKKVSYEDQVSNGIRLESNRFYEFHRRFSTVHENNRTVNNYLNILTFTIIILHSCYLARFT